jgi:protein SCO1
MTKTRWHESHYKGSRCVSVSPRLPVPESSHPPISLSPGLPVPASPRPRFPPSPHLPVPLSSHPPVSPSPPLPVSLSPSLLAAYCLLLTAFCFSVAAQPGMPQTSSPLYGARPLSGSVQSGLPKALQNVGIDQRLNEELPLDLVFRDETGQLVKLGQYFGSKPVVLSLVYYDCPMLCTQVLSGMVTAFRVMSFSVGKEFDVVTVSFDPREKPALAAAKKKTYLTGYQRPTAAQGWHYLTGDAESIRRLTDTVGFRYHFDEATNQFAHASAIMVLTPQGRLSHYFYGIEYSPRDLRLGLVEASANKIGSPVDQLLLYCYHYDPATGKYGAVVMNMMRVGGMVTLLGMVALLLLLRRRGAAQMRWPAGDDA